MPGTIYHGLEFTPFDRLRTNGVSMLGNVEVIQGQFLSRSLTHDALNYSTGFIHNKGVLGIIYSNNR